MNLLEQYPEWIDIGNDKLTTNIDHKIYILSEQEKLQFDKEVKSIFSEPNSRLELMEEAIKHFSLYGLRSSVKEVVLDNDFTEIQKVFNQELWVEAYYRVVYEPNVINLR